MTNSHQIAFLKMSNNSSPIMFFYLYFGFEKEIIDLIWFWTFLFYSFETLLAILPSDTNLNTQWNQWQNMRLITTSLWQIISRRKYSWKILFLHVSIDVHSTFMNRSSYWIDLTDVSGDTSVPLAGRTLGFNPGLHWLKWPFYYI